MKIALAEPSDGVLNPSRAIFLLYKEPEDYSGSRLSLS